MSTSSLYWPRPSEPVRELIRRGAELAQALPDEWLERLNQSLLTSSENGGLQDDPVICAAYRRANRAELLHWANANMQRPGEPVEPYVSVDMVDTVRELSRRGLSDALLNAARAAQNTAWELWMKLSFSLTRDPALLEELLDISMRSISGFINSNIQVMAQIAHEEKNAHLHDDSIDKRGLVSRLLDGRDFPSDQFARRLGYTLHQKHLAYVVWSESPEVEILLLEQMARTLAQAVGSIAPLIVFAGPSTLWVWCNARKPLEPGQLSAIAERFPRIRAAVGSPGEEFNGFRRSHLEAQTTQRLMGRLGGTRAIATIDQVRMVSLMTQDSQAAGQFVLRTLGRLATESTVLQHSLHAFLANCCNLTQTADALGTHRNTLLRRLERAQGLLPIPFAEHCIQIAAALELLIWNTSLEEK